MNVCATFHGTPSSISLNTTNINLIVALQRKSTKSVEVLLWGLFRFVQRIISIPPILVRSFSLDWVLPSLLTWRSQATFHHNSFILIENRCCMELNLIIEITGFRVNSQSVFFLAALQLFTLLKNIVQTFNKGILHNFHILSKKGPQTASVIVAGQSSDRLSDWLHDSDIKVPQGGIHGRWS